MTQSFLSAAAPAPRYPNALGQALVAGSRWLAIAGIGTLCAVALMLTFSIVLRKLFATQVPGDHEVVRMASALSVSMMLPWCQITGANIMVDLLTSKMSERVNRRLDQIGCLLLGLMTLLLAWRTGLLAMESHRSGSFSPMLAWPIWISQALMLPGLILTALNSFYVALQPGAMQRRIAFAQDNEGRE